MAQDYKEYILMHQDTDVIQLTLDQTTGAIASTGTLFQKEHLPVGIPVRRADTLEYVGAAPGCFCPISIAKLIFTMMFQTMSGKILLSADWKISDSPQKTSDTSLLLPAGV